MLQFLGLILTILLSICAVSRALPDLHKRMSAQQLQSVFHVDSLAAVPHYEVVQLLHNHEAAATAAAADESTLQHRRRRRSINVVSAASGATKESRHVKKDLSKNPYYSELKMAAASKNGIQSVDSTKVSPPSSFNAKDVRDIKEHNVSFQAFGEDLNLTLRATQGLFKEGPHKLRMWTVSSEPNATHGIDMKEVLDEDAHSSEEIGELFQDEANMAAILMRRHLETGDLIMEGSIGHEMVIKPLPHELSPHRDRTHHIVYKRETSSSDHLGDFAFMEPDDLVASEQLQRLQKRSRRSLTLAEQTDELQYAAELKEAADSGATRKRSKRTAPYIIYPEVLVIVDYDGYRLHGGDNLQVKRYFISFWNGVDLRYRLLKGPRIRISIAGIIISRGRDATPYLERNRVGRDAIDSAAALTDMGKYLFRERRLPVYDIAVAITKYDMCRRRKGGRCTKGTAGFAYVGGACVVNKRLEKVNSVAIIEDTGGFSGIIVAAHEVGHLLGAVHDGSPPPSYLGGPGAQRCRWEDGYIMSDLRHTERGFRWSACTVQSFHHFLNGDTATCLHNAPHEDGALGRSLPGSLLSLDAQCRRDRGTYACFKDQRVCAQLFCFDAQTGYCVAYRPAAEGSPCGNGMQCLDGRCQTLASNVIPDYEKQYRVVYNRADEADDNDEEDDDDDGDADDDDDDDGYDGNAEDDDDGNDKSEDKQPHEDVEENSIKSSDKEKQISEEGKSVSKLDNTVEETLLEVTHNGKEGPTITPTTTTAKSHTNITVTPPTTTPATPPSNLYTFEYLARFLDSTKMWPHFIMGLSAAAKPTQAPAALDAQIQQKRHYIITKTSTTSSISSRSSTKSSSSSNSSNVSSNGCSENEKHKHIQQPTPTEQHITEQKQQPQPKQHNTVRLHPTEFHKQFPKISSNFYLNPINNQSQQRTNQQQSSQTQTSTYSLTDDQDGDHTNYADGSEDDESNEAIERQNRNPEVTITTSVQQNPKQQQQQQLPTATTPTKSYGSGGGRLTPRYHTFFDAYLKKLQAVNGPLNQKERSTPLTTITTSVLSTTSTTSSTSSISTAQRKPAAAPNSYESFGAHFLKRTLSSSKNSNSSSDKISNSSGNNSTKPHNSATTPATSAQPAYVTNYIGDNSNNLPAVTVNVKQQEEERQQKQLEQAQQPSQQQQQQQLKIHKFTRRQLIRTQIK